MHIPSQGVGISRLCLRSCAEVIGIRSKDTPTPMDHAAQHNLLQQPFGGVS